MQTIADSGPLVVRVLVNGEQAHMGDASQYHLWSFSNKRERFQCDVALESTQPDSTVMRQQIWEIGDNE